MNSQTPQTTDEQLREQLANLIDIAVDDLASEILCYERSEYAGHIPFSNADTILALIQADKAQAVREARINSLLDLEQWAKLHNLDSEMILDGIEHMVISLLQVPDQPKLDHTERLEQLHHQADNQGGR
jgi:uncharacterized Ntn-hydrolase superfamily protein